VEIVKKGLWHHITQEQEDRAIQALKRYQEKQRGHPVSTGGVKEICACILSSVAKIQFCGVSPK
jgi:hypothetical protein